MGEAQVLEGTTEEITARLREAYPEQTLRVTVEPQEEEPLPDFSDYPHIVTSEAQLVGLLLEALNSSTRHEVTDETWEQRKAEIRRRAANRQEVLIKA